MKSGLIFHFASFKYFLNDPVIQFGAPGLDHVVPFSHLWYHKNPSWPGNIRRALVTTFFRLAVFLGMGDGNPFLTSSAAAVPVPVTREFIELIPS